MEKEGDVKVKANLQLPFYVREIGSRYPKGYHLSAKKDKKDTYWEFCDETSNKNKDKAKSHNSFSANQPQIQALKKDKCSCQRGHLVTRINATKIIKKDKDKASKNLSHIECYTYKQKDHYANKYSKKLKN